MRDMLAELEQTLRQFGFNAFLLTVRLHQQCRTLTQFVSGIDKYATAVSSGGYQPEKEKENQRAVFNALTQIWLVASGVCRISSCTHRKVLFIQLTIWAHSPHTHTPAHTYRHTYKQTRVCILLHMANILFGIGF